MARTTPSMELSKKRKTTSTAEATFIDSTSSSSATTSKDHSNDQEGHMLVIVNHDTPSVLIFPMDHAVAKDIASVVDHNNNQNNTFSKKLSKDTYRILNDENEDDNNLSNVPNAYDVLSFKAMLDVRRVEKIDLLCE